MSGLTIISAAFILTWTAESTDADLPRSFAILLVAFAAVLPEYAVDMYFSYRAGSEERYAEMAIANMTGANRLLIGIGWVTIIFLSFVFKKNKEPVVLATKKMPPELAFLFWATLWAFSIYFLDRFTLYFAAPFLFLFGYYFIMSLRGTLEASEVEGDNVTRWLKSLPTITRRLFSLFLFLFSCYAIWLSSEPFAEGIIQVGERYGIDQFLLVQWLAPLASEFPEIMVASIMTLEGLRRDALMTLISSKINQWTLLVGAIPIAYALGGGENGLPLTSRQREEVLLTAAQSFFALALLLDLKFGMKKALALLILFLTQIFMTHELARTLFALGYIVAGIIIILSSEGNRKRFLEILLFWRRDKIDA